MKTKLFIIGIFAFFILLLSFPKEALEGSTNGLLLWFHTVLPTLLPFIILTNFIIKLDAVHIICRFITPVCKKLFHIDSYGCYAMVTGFLCGYPMGAKIIADLLREHKISSGEGNYLLGICNNASPMFLIGYVITQSLNCTQHKVALLLILYGTPLIYAYFTRPRHGFAQKEPIEIVTFQQNSISNTTSSKKSNKAINNSLTFQLIDDSIMNGFETITRLGGYIILFAIMAKMATARIQTVTILNHLLIGFIEITNGIHSIGSASLPIHQQLPLATAIITLGGLSGLAQTKSMIQGTSLSIIRYMYTKLKIACLSTFATIIYCFLFIT